MGYRLQYLPLPVPTKISKKRVHIKRKLVISITVLEHNTFNITNKRFFFFCLIFLKLTLLAGCNNPPTYGLLVPITDKFFFQIKLEGKKMCRQYLLPQQVRYTGPTTSTTFDKYTFITIMASQCYESEC